MKVILKDEVPSLGGVGDVVQVADGYARNYLVPKGLAVKATRGNLKTLGAQRQAWLKKQQRIKEVAVSLKGKLESLSLNFSRKAGEDEKLFGSVTSIDIETALKEKGFDLDRRKINLTEPIKALGVFTVPVKLHPEVSADLKIWVVKE